MTRGPDVQQPKRRGWGRFVPVGVLAVGFVAFFALGLDRYLSLAALGEHHDALLAFTRDHLAWALVLYALTYVLVVAFSLPGGAVMTIAGGFLFGTLVAGMVTVAAATAGSVAVFWAARTAFADLLRARAGPWLQKIERGFNKDGVSYLLVLRLVPLFPFFVVNIAPAFLGVPTRIYVLTTFFGIVPGTFVYASVGNGLGALLEAGKTPDLGIIFEPEILIPILGLALLAMIPALYRKFFRKKAAP